MNMLLKWSNPNFTKLPNVTFNPMTPQIVSFSISFLFQLQVYSLVEKWTLSVMQVVFVTSKYRN